MRQPRLLLPTWVRLLFTGCLSTALILQTTVMERKVAPSIEAGELPVMLTDHEPLSQNFSSIMFIKLVCLSQWGGDINAGVVP